MSNPLTSLYLALEDLVAPLQERLASPLALESLFYRYGWKLQLDAADNPLLARIKGVQDALEAFLASAGAIRQELAEQPATSLGAQDLTTLASSAAALVEALAAFQPASLDGLADPLGQADFWRDIAERLLDDLLEQYLRVFQPGFYAVLRLWRVVTIDPQLPSGPFRVPYRRVAIDWSQLLAALKDPPGALQQAYHWGATDGSAFAHRDFLAALGDMLHALHLPARLEVPALREPGAIAAGEGKRVDDSAEALRSRFVHGIAELDQALYEIGVDVLPAAPAAAGPATGLLLRPVLRVGSAQNLPLGDSFSLQWQVSAEAADAIGVALFPDGVQLVGGAPALSTSVELVATRTTPFYLLGDATSARLEINNPALGFAVSGTLDAPDIRLQLKAGSSAAGAAPGCRVVLPLGDADEFVQQSVQRPAIDFGFSPEILWSSHSGFTFNGSPSLTIALPLAIPLGPLTLTDASITVGEGPPKTAHPGLRCRVGVSIRGKLGPLQFVVEQLGFTADLLPYTQDELAALPPGADRPVFGRLDVALGFAPPKGIGVAIDASGVVGGGYLFLDPDKGEYAGVLQLELAGRIKVGAVGLLDTRLPDGSRGYSLIVFITAEGFQPIPLGMGFMLEGIGGLLAINRTFDEAALRAGLKNNTLATLLFPPDPVANAPVILRNLSTAFPAKSGSYLLGPLAKIGWGTPTLIHFDLALILEFGQRKRLLVLGRISALLPSADEDLVRLNMDAMGVLDFDAGTIAVDAQLVDSRLLQKFVLTGAMALRAGVVPGPQAGFALAVGGMNPHFTPPVTMPPLEPITISLSSGDNPRLTCASYFALTSNTVQFGARASLHAGAHGFSIDGEIGYDVLLQLLPFHFLADFFASIQLKHGDTNLFKVKVSGELEGPRPLRVSAKATFEILWCDFSISFDKTLVEGEGPLPPPAIDALAELLGVLGAAAAWSAELPAGRRHGVSLRQPAAGAALALDPLGELTVRQTLLPLSPGRDMDFFGGAPLAGARQFAITAASLGGATPDVRPLRDFFAPAQFFDLTDDQKLVAPSFEEMQAGIVFGSDALAFDEAPQQWVAAPLEYESITLDEAGGETPLPTYPLPTVRLLQQVRFGAVARAPRRKSGLGRFAPPDTDARAVRLARPGWVVASTTDLNVRAPGLAAAQPWGVAKSALAALPAAAPGQPPAWQLVPAWLLPATGE